MIEKYHKQFCSNKCPRVIKNPTVLDQAIKILSKDVISIPKVLLIVLRALGYAALYSIKSLAIPFLGVLVVTGIVLYPLIVLPICALLIYGLTVFIRAKESMPIIEYVEDRKEAEL